MKKEDKKSSTSSHDNSFGVASVILGIFSILLSYPPVYGIALGIIAYIFGKKQQKLSPNAWGRRGTILAIIGILLSIVFFILLAWLSNNPEFQNQILAQYAP